ncbi:Helix-turn-helix domain protein [compost metagenome]
MNRQASKDILKAELIERVANNSSYSMRAMARQINLSPSLLSDVLNGKRKLSPERAFEVAKLLKFGKKKIEYFTTLVSYESAKTEDLRISLAEKLSALSGQNGAKPVDLDIFKAISEWYHLPILELTHMDDFKLAPESAAQALGISKNEAELAIDRLTRLELLEENEIGTLTKTDNRILAVSKVPNTALRKFHDQMFDKAKQSLTAQTPEEKFVGSETFVFDQEQLQEANEILEECFSRILNISKKSNHKRAVYHLGIQFFRLTAKELKS